RRSDLDGERGYLVGDRTDLLCVPVAAVRLIRCELPRYRWRDGADVSAWFSRCWLDDSRRCDGEQLRRIEHGQLAANDGRDRGRRLRAPFLGLQQRDLVHGRSRFLLAVGGVFGDGCVRWRGIE